MRQLLLRVIAAVLVASALTALAPVPLEEFASTVTEWHYLAGGLAIGFIVGAYWARRYHRTSHET